MSATLTLPDYGRVPRHSGRTCPAATSETSRIQGTLETEAAYLVDERVGAQCLITSAGQFCSGCLLHRPSLRARSLALGGPINS